MFIFLIIYDVNNRDVVYYCIIKYIIVVFLRKILYTDNRRVRQNVSRETERLRFRLLFCLKF